MSIIDQQKELEYYPDEVLAQEMIQPTGIAPSFLVATEIKRRNDMRNSYEMQMNQPPQMSVVEEQAMELQGIPNIDPNMMQQQMMQDPMMQEQMPQNAPMQMKEGGSIRYQSGQYIDPNLIAMGLTIDDEGKIVPIEDEAGLQGPFGNTIAGPEGWLLDTDIYTGTGEGGFGLGRPDNPYTDRGWARTGNIALDLAKAKLAQKGIKKAKKTWDKAGGFKGMTKGIRDKYNEGIAGLRARLGGTRTGTTPEINLPIPPNVGGFPKGIPAPIKPTSIAGKVTDVALNHPATTAVLGGGAVASVLPDVGTEVEATDVEAKEVSLTLEEKVELSGLLNDASINLTNIGFGQGGYSSFKKGSPRDQLNFLRAAKARGDMPEQSIINTPNNVETNVATSRSNVMDQINSILEGGGQSLRDQQGAALVQLGAGIAAGDLAGGLSAAGKEVSALKAARSAEKLKALSVMVELNYKQGLLDINEAQNILTQIEILKESVGDPQAEEKIARLEQRLAQLGGGIGTGIPSLPSDYRT